MNFYKLTYTHVSGLTQETYTHREWFTSERAAVKRRIELVDQGKIRNRKGASIIAVDVPVRRADLVLWLNQYVK